MQSAIRILGFTALILLLLAAGAFGTYRTGLRSSEASLQMPMTVAIGTVGTGEDACVHRILRPQNLAAMC